MKIVYIVHPISGDIEANLKKLQAIAREINLTEPEVVPFVPYYLDVICMDDNIPAERERGIKNDIAIMQSGMVDELRLYGDKISNGMWEEIEAAHDMGIVVIPATMETAIAYFKKYKDRAEKLADQMKKFLAASVIGLALREYIIKPVIEKNGTKGKGLIS